MACVSSPRFVIALLQATALALAQALHLALALRLALALARLQLAPGKAAVPPLGPTAARPQAWPRMGAVLVATLPPLGPTDARPQAWPRLGAILVAATRVLGVPIALDPLA